MATKRLACFLSLMVAMALGGCEGIDPAAPDTGPAAGSIHVEPDMFPSAIGTIWVYRVSYPGNDLADTIQVRITDTVRTYDGHLASVWTIVGKDYTRRPSYVAVFGDTVMFYVAIGQTAPSQQLELWSDHYVVMRAPIGHPWSSWGFDSTEVTAVTSLDVPAGHFDDVTAFTRSITDGPTSRYWLKPHVGFIRMEDPQFVPYIPREEWTLIRFIP